MDYFPGSTHFLLRATRDGSADNARGQTPTYVPIGTFAARSSAENCVGRLSRVHAFDGYVLTEESVRSLTHGSAVLTTVTYDTHGVVITPRSRARGAALPG
jgi:hypothetical protein